MDLKVVGQKIRQYRKIKGLTQEDLGKAINLSTMTIRRYESGERIIPEDSLKAIADALGILMVDLLDKNTLKIYNAGFVDGAVAESAENDMIDKLWKREYGYSGSDIEVQLIAAFSSLNDKGQSVAVERVEELTKIPDYQRTDTPEDK